MQDTRCKPCCLCVYRQGVMQALLATLHGDLMQAGRRHA